MTPEQVKVLARFRSGGDMQEVLDAGLCPGHPPEDYTGSQADWMVEMQTRGHWNGEGWHGDIWLVDDEWWDILETCEGVPEGECSVHCNDDGHHETCRATEGADR